MQEAVNGGWNRQPHFSNELLAPLHELNHRFLDLLGRRGGDWHAPGSPAPPGEVIGGIAPLSAEQRASAAHCPYALFDLRFQEDEHWRSRLGASARWRIADDALVDAETAAFVRLALFYAWHAAVDRELAAQLLLGMSEHTAAAFRCATLNHLLTLAASESAHLTARWQGSSVYWCALTHAAARTRRGPLAQGPAVRPAARGRRAACRRMSPVRVAARGRPRFRLRGLYACPRPPPAHQDLQKRHQGAQRDRSRGRGRRFLRAARPERRGQDDRHRHRHLPGQQDQRHGRGFRPRHRPRTRGGEVLHRRGAAGDQLQHVRDPCSPSW